MEILSILIKISVAVFLWIFQNLLWKINCGEASNSWQNLRIKPVNLDCRLQCWSLVMFIYSYFRWFICELLFHTITIKCKNNLIFIYTMFLTSQSGNGMFWCPEQDLKISVVVPTPFLPSYSQSEWRKWIWFLDKKAVPY